MICCSLFGCFCWLQIRQHAFDLPTQRSKEATKSTMICHRRWNFSKVLREIGERTIQYHIFHWTSPVAYWKSWNCDLLPSFLTPRHLRLRRKLPRWTPSSKPSIPRLLRMSESMNNLSNNTRTLLGFLVVVLPSWLTFWVWGFVDDESFHFLSSPRGSSCLQKKFPQGFQSALPLACTMTRTDHLCSSDGNNEEPSCTLLELPNSFSHETWTRTVINEHSIIRCTRESQINNQKAISDMGAVPSRFTLVYRYIGIKEHYMS